MARILFVMNVFPGLGGVESVTENIIGDLSRDNEIFILAYSASKGFALPAGVTEAFYFENRVEEDNIALYNGIIASRHITHVINQGIYPFFTGIVFNEERDRSVKIISVLHGMPGYEVNDYWCQDHIRKAGPLKKAERKLLYFLGMNRGYNRYVRRYREGCIKALEEGDKVVLLCEKYIGEFCSLYGTDNSKGKIVAIPNPLSAMYSDLPAPDFDGKDDSVLFVGRMSYEKNPAVILDAWKLCKRGRLTMIGDGPLLPSLSAYAKKKNIGNVEFTGYITDPERYYSKAKIIVLVSKYEGYPMVLIEAQRYGTVPVVFPISSGVDSIVDDGRCGVIVPQRSVQALAESIDGLLSDEKRLRALSREAYLKSCGNELQVICGKWRELLR